MLHTLFLGFLVVTAYRLLKALGRKVYERYFEVTVDGEKVVSGKTPEPRYLQPSPAFDYLAKKLQDHDPLTPR